MMAKDRKMIEEAYAGDIIGVFDPGIFSIGDTLTICHKHGSHMRESRRSHRSISQESVRWIQ